MMRVTNCTYVTPIFIWECIRRVLDLETRCVITDNSKQFVKKWPRVDSGQHRDGRRAIGVTITPGEGRGEGPGMQVGTLELDLETFETNDMELFV